MSSEVAILLGAFGAFLTAVVGWYTARNARRGQADTHSLESRKAGITEAQSLVELSSNLVKSINDELDRVRQSLATERERREKEEDEVKHLRDKLQEAEDRIDDLLRELERAEVRTHEMQDQMAALSAELREYRARPRLSSTRTRVDDDEDGDLGQ